MSIENLEFRNGVIKKAMTASECAGLLRELDGWQVERRGRDELVKTFTFEDFRQAMRFAGRVSELAEAFHHHPELTIEYGRATVRWWTHTASGVTRNDFVLARETDKAFPDPD